MLFCGLIYYDSRHCDFCQIESRRFAGQLDSVYRYTLLGAGNDLRVTDEKGGEVSFTAVSTAGTDLRGALSLALAQAGCPVLSLSAETMSLEDVFLQLTETPESGKPESTAAPAENPPAEAAAEEANEKEANSDESNL